MFTSGVQEWCRQNQAECLAVQLPGRNMRKSEKPLDSCQEVAQALFPILASKLQSMPYMVTSSLLIVSEVISLILLHSMAQSPESDQIRHKADLGVGPSAELDLGPFGLSANMVCCQDNVLRPQVVAHSVGCWNAFEFLQLARQRGLRMPSKVFLSAMAAPTIPPESRPWRQQHLLSEEQFKVFLFNRSSLRFTPSPFFPGAPEPCLAKET